METLQDRLTAIRRKRKRSGKELGILLMDGIEAQIDRTIPFFNGTQYNETMMTLNEGEYNIYLVYRTLYYSVVQLRNKAVDLRKQFKGAMDSLALTINEQLQDSTTRVALKTMPAILNADEFNKLREKALLTMLSDEKYTLEILLEGFLDSMDGSIDLIIPHDIYNELTRLKGVSAKGSRHEAALHKNLYKLSEADNTEDSDSIIFDINSPGNPFIKALETITPTPQAQYFLETQAEEMNLFFQGGDAIRRYCYLKTKSRPSQRSKALENTIEELIDHQGNYDYIYSKAPLRNLQNALGFYPHVDYIGKADELEDNASLYQALRYCIEDSKEGKLILSRALRAEYPELLRLLREYIKTNTDQSLYIKAQDGGIDSYFIVALAQTETEAFVHRVKSSGLAIIREPKHPREKRGGRTLAEDYLIDKKPHKDINYSNFYLTIAYINSYNVLLELIDSVFSTRLSEFAKLDLNFYGENREIYNRGLAIPYYQFKYTYSGEELENKRYDYKHRLNFQYLRDEEDFMPTLEAKASVKAGLKDIYSKLEKEPRLRLIEEYSLAPLLRSTGIGDL